MGTLSNNVLNCCGCEVCTNVCTQSAIAMVEDAYGFRYPQIDTKKCIDCGACIKKCDFQKLGRNGVETNAPIEAYAAYHQDEQVLMASASGGVFFAFAQYVLSRGGCVYGCIIDDDFNVRIVRGDTVEDVERMRGSKYVQGEMGYIYEDVKTSLRDRLVLFTGTPCQVAALKSYLGNYRTDNLITIDLVCHGVSSVKSFKLYLSFLEKTKKIKVKQYRFRSKEIGWGLSGAVEIVSEKKGKLKKRIVLSKNDFYKSNFLSWNTLRPACTSCKYATFSRTGDFTMGDYWGWEKLGLALPSSKGLSVLLVNSPKWSRIIYDLNLNLVKTPLNIAQQGNETFNHPTQKGHHWEEFMMCVAENDYRPLYIDFEKYKKNRDWKEKKKRIRRIITFPLRKLKKLF